MSAGAPLLAKDANKNSTHTLFNLAMLNDVQIIGLVLELCVLGGTSYVGYGSTRRQVDSPTA